MNGRWLALLPAVTLWTACSSPLGGAPSAESGPPNLPPRPKVLRIDGIDPCGTLTPAQFSSLNVVRYGGTGPGNKRGPSCDWIHDPQEPIENYSVDINTHGGVELLFGQPQLEVITVAGFGAVQTPALYGTGTEDCLVNVDVAPGEAVQVGYFYNGTTVPMTHALACEKARHAAELAMQTILTQA